MVAEAIKMDASVAVKRPMSFYVSLFFGSLFLCLLLPCIFINERMILRTREWLNEHKDDTATVDLDSEYSDPADYAYRLVYAYGTTSMDKPAKDENFAVNIENTMVLRRVVERY